MRIRQAVGVLLIGSAVLFGCGDDDDEASAPASGNRDDITQEECVEAATAMAQAATDIPLALSGTSGDLRESVDAFQSFAADAPSEISDELGTIADGYDDFVKVLADTNFDPASGQPPSADTAAKIQAAANELNTTEFVAARDRVTKWFADECGS